MSRDDDDEFKDLDDSWFGDPELLAQLENASANTARANTLASDRTVDQLIQTCGPQASDSKVTRQATLFESFGMNIPNAKPATAPPLTTRSAQQRPLPMVRMRDHSKKQAESTTFQHPFDPEAVKTWQYPTNRPIRDYQYNMVQTSLFTNTLIALPTGLGKTFIAAVVMFNYFRWFPEGKIVFMAPTKPLVAQQIEACYQITGIPQDVTDEMTGVAAPELRQKSWHSKRVFFLTPQVMQNDLKKEICPSEKVVLVVVDEAHRALGKHAYCEVVKILKDQNAHFRILALTATPAAEVKTVQSLIQNLLISKIEIRTEDSLDIRPFTFKRKLEVVVVQPSEDILNLAAMFEKVISLYLTRLVSNKAFYDRDPKNLSRYSLILAREKWRETSKPRCLPGLAAAIESDFGITVGLADCMVHLMSLGIRMFLKHLDDYIDDTINAKSVTKAREDLMRRPEFNDVVRHARALTERPEFVSHPKVPKMAEIVVSHFLDHQNNQIDGEARETRVMIFTQYRDTVEEIVQMLSPHAPLVRAMSFVGHGKSSSKGLTQKEQMKVVADFQAGNHNVLVATCIGEEGLDIGEVDLILCYDAQNSPIRMLQRMGRTGRKREGRVVLVLSQGREEDAYRRSQAQYRTVQNAIVDGKKLVMANADSGLLPKHVKPIVEKKDLEIEAFDADKKTVGGRSSRGVRGRPSVLTSVTQKEGTSAFLTEAQQEEFERLFKPQSSLPFKPDLSRQTHWQTMLIPTVHLRARSLRTRRYVDKMQLIRSLELDEEEHPAGADLDALEFSFPERFLPVPAAQISSAAKRKADDVDLLDSATIIKKRLRTSPFSEDSKSSNAISKSPGGDDCRFGYGSLQSGRKRSRTIISECGDPRIAVSDDEEFVDVKTALLNGAKLGTNCESDLIKTTPQLLYNGDNNAASPQENVQLPSLSEKSRNLQNQRLRGTPTRLRPAEAAFDELVPDTPTGPTMVSSADSRGGFGNVFEDEIIRSSPELDFSVDPKNEITDLPLDYRPTVPYQDPLCRHKTVTFLTNSLLLWPSRSNQPTSRNARKEAVDHGGSTTSTAGLLSMDTSQSARPQTHNSSGQNSIARRTESAIQRKHSDLFEGFYAIDDFDDDMVIALELAAACADDGAQAGRTEGFGAQDGRGVIDSPQNNNRMSRESECENFLESQATPVLLRKSKGKRVIADTPSTPAAAQYGNTRAAEPSSSNSGMAIRRKTASVPHETLLHVFEEGENENTSDQLFSEDDDQSATGETPMFHKVLRRRITVKPPRKPPRDRSVSVLYPEPQPCTSTSNSKWHHRRPGRRAEPDAIEAFLDREAVLSDEYPDSGDEIIDGDIDIDLPGFVVSDGRSGSSPVETRKNGTESSESSSPIAAMYHRSLLNRGKNSMEEMLNRYRTRMKAQKGATREDWEGFPTQRGAGAEATEYYDDPDLADFVVDDDDEISYTGTAQTPSARTCETPRTGASKPATNLSSASRTRDSIATSTPTSVPTALQSFAATATTPTPTSLASFGPLGSKPWLKHQAAVIRPEPWNTTVIKENEMPPPAEPVRGGSALLNRLTRMAQDAEAKGKASSSVGSLGRKPWKERK
ncbi:hypothetical protein DFJ73DRAFT_760943 [Zopfochytrium polystomum]|nr:hypothetical protein DFJ73DRAFT_760943 [Zopfochytrium polystomum]